MKHNAYGDALLRRSVSAKCSVIGCKNEGKTFHVSTNWHRGYSQKNICAECVRQESYDYVSVSEYEAFKLWLNVMSNEITWIDAFIRENQDMLIIEIESALFDYWNAVVRDASRTRQFPSSSKKRTEHVRGRE